ncbi:MAG: DinB family protein [Litoreibacter sp.]|nr:DinB family protein [Litoreibacter sp.]MCY4333057.1 DinB family protein [Litoreibacter sp.]
MITAEYCRTMAAYNAWQNKSLMGCIKALDEKELTKNRKAFFGSILGTANHLLWGDQLWMSRFDGGAAPQATLPDSTKLHLQAEGFLLDRLRTDKRIIRWAEKLKHMDLVGPMTWYSSTTQHSMTMQKSTCVTHFFNHQTHHRGQLHAMMTAAGQSPDATDLVFMPE